MVSGKKSREIREIVEKTRKEQERKDRRVKILVWSIVAVIVLSLGSVVGATFYHAAKEQAANDPTKWSQGEQLTPKNADKYGAFHVTPDQPETAVRFDNFFDPICPGCGGVDRSIGDRVAELAEEGKIDVYLTPVAFLDKSSIDRYSTRAVNAFVTVAEYDPELALKFQHEIFAKDFQPQEGTGKVTVTDKQLEDLAVKVGVPSETAKSIREHHYAEWIENLTKTVTEKRTDLFPDGFSTPAVFLNMKYDQSGKASGTRISFGGGDILSVFETQLAKASGDDKE